MTRSQTIEIVTIGVFGRPYMIDIVLQLLFILRLACIALSINIIQ